MNENHKTPYELKKCGAGCHRHIEASDGTRIGTVNVIGDSEEIPNFVVTACNSHAALVEACKAAAHLYEKGCVDRGYKDETNWIDDVHDRLIAALAQAESGTTESTEKRC